MMNLERKDGRNVNKEIVWDIIRCAILSYQGAEPTHYGFDPEIARIGKQLADALFSRSKGLVSIERLRKLYSEVEK